MTGYIYRIHCLANNKDYIGQTIDLQRRKNQHFGALSNNNHTNKKLQNAYNLFGKDNFEFTYWSFDNITKEQLNELEIEYIKKYNSYENGFNLTPGGDNPPLLQRISNEDAAIALVIINNCPDGYGKAIEDFFNWPKGTASRLKLKKGYPLAWEIYENFSSEDKDLIFHEYISDIKQQRLKNLMKEGGCEKSYSLVQEDFNFAFCAQEIGYGYSEVASYLGTSPSTIKDWFNGRSRKKEKQEYLNLSDKEKEQLKEKVINSKLEQYIPKRGLKIKEKDVLSYLCFKELYGGKDSEVQKFFGWAEGTCYNIRKEGRYPALKAKFKLLSEDQKKEFADNLKTAVLKSRN